MVSLGKQKIGDQGCRKYSFGEIKGKKRDL